jgi:small-conductance mechanosensitive channel
MTDIITSLQQVAGEIIAMIPNLLAALILLLIGWIVGRLLGKYIALFLDRIGIGDAMAKTSIGMALEEQYGGGNRGIIRFFELLVRWFIYLIAILAAANVLQLTFLTSLVQSIVAFIPNIAMFLIILVIGFLLIDYFARFVRGIGDVQKISLMGPIVSILEVFLYFVVVMLALEQLRLDLTIIYIFITPLAWGIGLGVGAAIAIIVGFGLRERAPEMMDDLLDQIRRE